MPKANGGIVFSWKYVKNVNKHKYVIQCFFCVFEEISVVINLLQLKDSNPLMVWFAFSLFKGYYNKSERKETQIEKLFLE